MVIASFKPKIAEDCCAFCSASKSNNKSARLSFRIRLPAHFENGEKVTVAKFELAFTRHRHNLKTLGNLMVRSRCRTLMPKKSIYSLRIDQSRSKSVENVLFT